MGVRGRKEDLHVSHPCDTNSDCKSGFCIESYYGDLCTKFCIEDCPWEWECKAVEAPGADLVFVCVPV